MQYNVCEVHLLGIMALIYVNVNLSLSGNILLKTLPRKVQ